MSKQFDQYDAVSMPQGSGAGSMPGDITASLSAPKSRARKGPSLPPLWKLKRELYRVAEKANERLPLQYMQDLVRQRHHDMRLGKVLRETAGALSLSNRVAIFILYQPKGIAESTYFTLDHMAWAGWSVVVVSNTPLRPADREQLASKSAQVIERPNVGYDFGAYREGWRWLERQAHQPQRMILMNDSTWFPLRAGDDSLARMEAMDADLTGHVFKTEKTEDHGRDHIESHLLMFGPRALANPAIRSFMKRYVMSSSKSATIRRGEKGISQAAMASGLTVKALFGREEMVALFAGLSDDDLLVAVRNLAMHNDAGRDAREAWLAAAAEGRPWREAFLTWTFRELSNSRQHLVGATFIDPAISFGGLGYLKKHSEPRFQLARLAVLRGLQENRIAPLDPRVAEEIVSSVHAWKRPVDWRDDPNKVQVDLRL